MDAGVAALRGRLWMWARLSPYPQPRQIYLQSSIGSPPQLISAPGRDVYGWAVSDDGNMIAISYQSPGELYVGPTDGGPAQLVRSGPGWIQVSKLSPDKGFVAFTEGYQYDSSAKLMPLDGGPAIEIFPPLLMTSTQINTYQSTFSPDSRHLAWLGQGRTIGEGYVVDTATGIVTQLTTYQNWKMAWASNTTFLLNVWPPGSTGLAPSLNECVVPNSCTMLSGYSGTRTLDVSSDRSFALIGIQSPADAGGYLDLYRAPLDGGPVISLSPLTSTRTFCGMSLSPDGEHLAACDAVGVSVFSTSAAAQPTRLLSLPSNLSAYPAAFDLDSTQYFFVSSLGGRGSALHRVPLAAPGQSVVVQEVDGGIVVEFVITP